MPFQDSKGCHNLSYHEAIMEILQSRSEYLELRVLFPQKIFDFQKRLFIRPAKSPQNAQREWMHELADGPKHSMLGNIVKRQLFNCRESINY